jgi:hypothetical protein
MRLISTRRGLALAILAMATGPGLAAPAAAFPVLRFFEGRTEGTGRLKVLLRSAETVGVASFGRVAEDGTLLLAQTVSEGGKAPRTREWRIRETAPGRYSGSLTDAIGPVTGETVGDRLRLRYRMKGDLRVEQWLTLAPGGRAASNRLVVRKFGLTVATLDETIRKRD